MRLSLCIRGWDYLPRIRVIHCVRPPAPKSTEEQSRAEFMSELDGRLSSLRVSDLEDSESAVSPRRRDVEVRGEFVSLYVSSSAGCNLPLTCIEGLFHPSVYILQIWHIKLHVGEEGCDDQVFVKMPYTKFILHGLKLMR